MKKIHAWMLIGCLVFLLVAFCFPQFRGQLASVPLLAAVLMLVCCLAPLLLLIAGFRGDGGCCADKPAEASGKADGPDGTTGKSCH